MIGANNQRYVKSSFLFILVTSMGATPLLAETTLSTFTHLVGPMGTSFNSALTSSVEQYVAANEPLLILAQTDSINDSDQAKDQTNHSQRPSRDKLVNTFSTSVTDEQMIDMLLYMISLKDQEKARTNALDDLRRLGQFAITQLINRAQSENESTRVLAIWTLGEVGMSPSYREPVDAYVFGLSRAVAAIPMLTESLDDRSHLIRAASAEALGKIGNEANGAAPKLMQLLKDDQAIVRYHAAVAIGHIGSQNEEAVIDALTLLLNDADSGVRSAATKAIGRWDEMIRTILFKSKEVSPSTRRVAKALIIALENPDPKVQELAAKYLQGVKCEAEQAVPLLRKRLKSEVVAVRYYSAAALSSYGSNASQAIADLERLQSDSNQQVRLMAAKAIRRINQAGD